MHMSAGASHIAASVADAGAGIPSKLRVLLVDDQAVIRMALRRLLSSCEHIEIVGEAEDGLAAIQLAQRLLPDVTIMDVNMPRMDGIEATRRITAGTLSIRVIGLSLQAEPLTVAAMREAGAAVHLSKCCDPMILVEAILAGRPNKSTAACLDLASF